MKFADRVFSIEGGDVMHDVIIIGRGPAGYSAAIYTARAKMDTLVIGKNDSLLNKAELIDNYFGMEGPVQGNVLLANGEKQALRFGAQIIEDEVVSITKNEFFEVHTSNGTYEAKAVLIATGQAQKKMNIQNIEMFEGKGVSYCSACDGFFFRNKKIGVIGSKNFAVHEAEELAVQTKEIILYTNGAELQLTGEFKEKAEQFVVNDKKILKLEGSETLERIVFEDGTSDEIQGVFIANESASSADFARALGIMTEGASIVVDKFQQTNFEGIFAAGDCTGGFKQVSTSVGEGALASKKISEYVRGKR